MIPYLRLVRVGTLFSPAADVIAGACISGTPWSVDLARAAGASVCIYAAGMVLNDHADRAEDAVQRPERPIPSGRVSPTTALLFGMGLLAAGLVLSPFLVYYAVMALLVVAYDYAFKRVAWAGALTMGTLRGLNLMAGAVFASQSLPTTQIVWIAAFVYAIYIVCVTVLGMFEDDPKVPARAVVGIQSVPPLAAPLVLLGLPERTPAVAIGFALALAFGLRVRRQGREWPQAAIRKSMTWLLLGTMCYTSLLCLASGRWPEALGIAAAIPVAKAISRRIALT